MSAIDWTILIVVLAGLIAYGIYKSHTSKNLNGYFLNNNNTPWYLVLLGIMGTQASAITYLTGPGQAYTDGLRFVQYYYGLPLAMIVISIFFVSVFNKLKVFTPYEFLEKRFDGRTRLLTSFLFLISRGLSTGISIYAPSLVLSSLMGWNIYLTNVVMGGVLIIYTMSGGAKAVAHTQGLQMIIIFLSLFIIGYIIINMLPAGVGLKAAIDKATAHGKMNIITTGFTENGFNWKDKYNIWSGLIGGFFLALSYFGTDHSQVGRYISAKNVKESRRGLLLNGLVKIPMQYLVLMLGVLVFSFYLFNKAPVYFDETKQLQAENTSFAGELKALEAKYNAAFENGNIDSATAMRSQYKTVMQQALNGQEANDTNFIFLRFVKDNLPVGLIGLLFAIIFLSGWGSVAAAINSLAACTVVDFHKKMVKSSSDENDYRMSQWYTLAWGIFCIGVAMFANNIGNSLIEAVNILGSLFYGVILGIFLVAFWLKNIGGKAVFISAIVSEIIILLIYNADIVSFLWLNVIGAMLVIAIGLLVQFVLAAAKKPS
ncbi:MAG: sodium:solute symporter [Chitinophagaceae bacterium]|jgi:SSS family transporter|nr:sodium:solute symporter [Chitinophagaceae bacterium]MBP6046707.1 sodium:solute symporter [Ferruginibacter sp.]MBK8929759.1 sodium:solute symporter [Chitinophagaceae bacterium]MBP6370917.1 sodium:solute symporter [Ferruginibacter sp.]MBP6987921.1 sodium:solute symporter [Ferruginibacter sp.]